ncbi:cytochrome P450 71A4-like protein [Tanacetum coccineum]
MKTHDLIFSNRPKLSITGKLTYGFKDIGFAPYGEHWRQVKSTTVLHLLSHKRVQSFRHIREREMTRLIDKSFGSMIDLTEMLVSLTNNIICQVALGRTFRLRLVRGKHHRFQILLGVLSIGTYIPWLSWVDWLCGLEGKTNKLAKEIDEFLDGVIEDHVNKNKMADGNVDGGNDQSQYLVDILLDVQREDTTNFIFDRGTIKAVIMDVLLYPSDGQCLGYSKRSFAMGYDRTYLSTTGFSIFLSTIKGLIFELLPFVDRVDEGGPGIQVSEAN